MITWYVLIGYKIITDMEKAEEELAKLPGVKEVKQDSTFQLQATIEAESSQKLSEIANNILHINGVSALRRRPLEAVQPA